MGISLLLSTMYETKWNTAKDDADDAVVAVVEAIEDGFESVDGQIEVAEEHVIRVEVYNNTIDETADIFTEIERYVLNVVGVSDYTISTSGKSATLKFVTK